MKNSFRKIMALLMAIMMLAALGMSVSAEDGGATVTDKSIVSFTKTLTKDANVYAPNTTYTFTIESGTEVAAATNQPAIYAGELDEVAFVAGTGQTLGTSGDDELVITSAPDVAVLDQTSLTYTCQIKVDVTKYEDPGIYRYIVAETKGDYKGVTYDETTRTLDVYIESDDNNTLTISGCVLYKSAGDKGGFTNAYDTANLEISKTVAGNLGDRNKSFDFSITVTGVDGEKYHAVHSDGTTYELGTGVAQGFRLTHGQQLTVYGLSTNDSYEVTETDYSGDGYNTTIEVNDAPATAGTGSIANGTDGKAADATVAFTNEKKATVPTGVAMDVLPFVAMIVVAGVLALLFFRKKERREA